MELGVPAQFAPLLLSRALSRQLFVYAAISLIVAEISLVAIGINVNQPTVVWATALLVPSGIALTGLMFLPPSPWLAAIFVALGGIGLFASAAAVLAHVDNAPSTALAPFALVAIALILSCGVASRTFGRVIWAMVGFLVGLVSLLAAAFVADSEFRPDARSVIGVLLVMGIAFIVPNHITLAAKAQRAFEVSLDEIEADELRTEMSRDAVARLHDTLLADLTVLTRIKPGPLSKDVRALLEVELAHLVSTDWLVSEIEKSSIPLRESSDASLAAEAFLAALDEASGSGLGVNVSGDLPALAALPPNSAAALVGAIRQCLANVIEHSGILTVDVVVLGTGDGVTVTVIDGGVGFEPDQVDGNRLGLRVSVRSRIEHVGGFVRIWSIPGQGTAIMIQLPYGGDA